VENDDKLQDVLREKLKKLGYRVLIASDPARAFDRYQQSPYEVLIMDVGTVGEEGVRTINSVLRKSRNVNMACHALVIVSEDQSGIEAMIDPDLSQKVTILKRPLKMNDLTNKLMEIAPIAPSTDE